MRAQPDLQPHQIPHLLSQIPLSQLFPHFTNIDILQCLRQRNLHQFLLNIPSFELRRAAEQREKREDEQAAARARTAMKYNVLDMTLKEVIKHCQDNRLIPLFNWRDSVYKMDDHYELGMKLVHALPEKYEVGARSHHFNLADKLERMYGIARQRKEEEWHDQEEQEEQDEDQDQEQDQEQQQAQEYEQEEEFEDSEGDFVNDEQEKSDYEPSQQQLQKMKKRSGKKLKKIKKHTTIKDKKATRSTQKTRNSRRKINRSGRSQQISYQSPQDNSKEQQIYQEEQEQIKQIAATNDKKSKNKKKMTIQSSESEN